MSDKELPAIGGMTFEEFKRTNEHGAEYWSARDLQPLLGYTQWRRFEQAVERAISSCQQSGNKPDYHFAGAGKPIAGGKGAVQARRQELNDQAAADMDARIAVISDTRAKLRQPRLGCVSVRMGRGDTPWQ